MERDRPRSGCIRSRFVVHRGDFVLSKYTICARVEKDVGAARGRKNIEIISRKADMYVQ